MLADVERSEISKHGLPELIPHIVHRRNRYQLLVGIWVLITLYPVFVFFTGAPSPVPSVSTLPSRAVSPVADSSSQHIWQEASSAVRSSLNLAPNSPQTQQPVLKNALAPGTVIHTPDRAADVSNAFANFTQSPNCTYSSLDLHDPFFPLCPDRESLLTAMTDGGRIGIDAPFSPRGCDMRWYTTDEICKILDKFERISIIGDSMMRNLAVGLHTLVRNDFINGPRQSWRAGPEGHDCSCGGPFNDGHCIFYAAFSSQNVLENDPDSMKCGRTAPIECESTSASVIAMNIWLIHMPAVTPLLTYPLEQKALDNVIEQYAPLKPAKPHVFVYGHGMWNGINTTATSGWLDQVNGALKYQMPWLNGRRAFFPRLVVTPNAAGDAKPKQFVETQGNVALKKFEREVAALVKPQGMDHLGTWNMTVQTTSPDGTHAGMRSVLTKAMMVLNWLDTIDVSEYR